MIAKQWLRRDMKASAKIGMVLLLGALVAFAGFTLTSARDSDVVAVINGAELTKERFYERLEQEAGARVLEQLIVEMLVEQAQTTHGAAVSDAEVEAELAEFRANYQSEEEFQQDLARFNVSLDQIRYEIRLSLIVEKLSTQGVVVTDEEIAAFFDANKQYLDEPEEALVRHILVNTQGEADEIVALLNDGGDFAELARGRSLDTASAVQGGSIGYIQRDSPIVAPFLEAVFSLTSGQTSAPVQSDFGWHIIRVDELKEARPASLESSSERIREHLLYDKSRSVGEIIDELRESATIDVLWSGYEDLAHRP